MFKLLFWISLTIIFYAYIGYTVILWIFGIFIRKKESSGYNNEQDLPEVTHVIAAYNEIDVIPDKIENCLAINYPENKIKHLWVIDGSSDGSENILEETPDITYLHNSERKGKTAALNRAMPHVSTSITVFSDANSMLSGDSVKNLVKKLSEEKVGCVAGEKRIIKNNNTRASGAGEGLYWNYESVIKKLEARFGSTMGAVGELYAIKTSLYPFPPENTILDDFVVSLDIAQRGYKISYANNAIASEHASLNIREEMKRKIRIAAGGFQTFFRYPGLLNIFKHPRLSFQFFSHKVLRWLFVPVCLLLLLITNIFIVISGNTNSYFRLALIAQTLFYLLAFIGLLFRNKSIRLKMFFMPYYLLMMNYSQIAGFIRFVRKRQKVVWEKSSRA